MPLSMLPGDLEARFPGIEFRIVDEPDRIRAHIKSFIGGEMARSLAGSIAPGGDAQIVWALSGG